MIIYCSKAMQKALKLKKTDLLSADDVRHEGDDLFHWHAHIAEVDGRVTMILVNDKTRYAIIFRNRLPRAQASFVKLVQNAIPYTFEVEGYNSTEIMNYMKKMDEIVFGEKSDRSISGNINLFLHELPELWDERWDASDSTQALVSHWKNDFICKCNGQYIKPRDTMSEALDALTALLR